MINCHKWELKNKRFPTGEISKTILYAYRGMQSNRKEIKGNHNIAHPDARTLKQKELRRNGAYAERTCVIKQTIGHIDRCRQLH